MSPGPLTSHTRGGLNFQHGGGRSFGHRNAPFYGTREAPLPVNRALFGGRQKFTVSPNDAGGSTITLTEDEVVSVGTNDEGGVEITIGAKPEPEAETNGNGNGNGTQQRGLRRKMALMGNPDGSLTVEPEPGYSLVVLCDADEMVVVGEVADGE
jgi:hypothetical protein